MESKGSLLCLRETTTSPYPEPDLPVHMFPPYFPKIHSIIIYVMSSEWSLYFNSN